MSTIQLTAMLLVRSVWTTPKAGLPKRPSCQYVSITAPRTMHEPKILTRFSAASQNSAVSTPASVMVTSTKDCHEHVLQLMSCIASVIQTPRGGKSVLWG